jgi:hypothetical protein
MANPQSESLHAKRSTLHPPSSNAGETHRPRWFLAAAPLAAVAAGLGAEWLDFRELRVVFLLGVAVGVLLTAWALFGRRGGARTFVLTAALGIATWASAEAIYTIIHPLLGEQFHASRFGPQWAQALGLIAAHGLFLGLPTGIAAALLLRLHLVRARLHLWRTPAPEAP